MKCFLYFLCDFNKIKCLLSFIKWTKNSIKKWTKKSKIKSVEVLLVVYFFCILYFIFFINMRAYALYILSFFWHIVYSFYVMCILHIITLVCRI
jgi:hypothetical protein